MHHVNERRMPDARARTGWRWRNTFDSITIVRLRAVVGGPCRKMLFQTCVPRSQSPAFFSIVALRAQATGRKKLPASQASSSTWHFCVLSTQTQPSAGST